MENNEVPSKIERGEVWTIAVVVTLFILMAEVVLITAFWDQICAKVMINALEYGMKQMATPQYRSAIPPMQDRRPASRRPKPWHQLSHAEKVEKVRAGQERLAPSETFTEELNRINRERKELEAYLFDVSDVNE